MSHMSKDPSTWEGYATQLEKERDNLRECIVDFRNHLRSIKQEKWLNNSIGHELLKLAGIENEK